MEQETLGHTGAGLVRQPGRRGGCSCCGFTMLGLVAMPVLALVLAFVVL